MPPSPPSLSHPHCTLPHGGALSSTSQQVYLQQQSFFEKQQLHRARPCLSTAWQNSPEMGTLSIITGKSSPGPSGACCPSAPLQCPGCHGLNMGGMSTCTWWQGHCSVLARTGCTGWASLLSWRVLRWEVAEPSRLAFPWRRGGASNPRLLPLHVCAPGGVLGPVPPAQGALRASRALPPQGPPPLPFMACLSPTGLGCCGPFHAGGPLQRGCRCQVVEAAIHSSGLCRTCLGLVELLGRMPQSLYRAPMHEFLNRAHACSREPCDKAWGDHSGCLPYQGLCHPPGCPQGCTHGSCAHLIARAAGHTRQGAGLQGCQATLLLTVAPHHPRCGDKPSSAATQRRGPGALGILLPHTHSFPSP